MRPARRPRCFRVIIGWELSLIAINLLRWVFDINIGAAEDGVALRRLADSPWDEIKEIRFVSVFFSRMYFAPVVIQFSESASNWMKIRRAMLRNVIDRIGYGGYLSLASEFPDFISQVETICDEF